ncbi:hypothetical protein CPB84DRAFT_1313671 [Gymnopilus junonius]|uniref:F-box domain-containing protein n=1 Tax=Gymnopilus junonius TaxID=109634 RepID=A0A9P5TLK4_GYMJU|nr:hypothetical protein CPB84DRAFT_1313671 [Gymnopilus junonius]
MTKFSPMAKSLSAYIPSAFLTKKKRRCHQIQDTFKLNPDLLYVIFMACLQLEQRFNVSSLGYRTTNLISPLLTACRISQVCREWRQVSLNAPLIWANAIDLGLLARKERTLKVNPRSKRWNLSDEIMRRTGSEATFYACGSVDWRRSARGLFSSLGYLATGNGFGLWTLSCGTCHLRTNMIFFQGHCCAFKHPD